MQVAWLGQGGFLFETHGQRVMVDPYLSNSMEETGGSLYHRLVPVDERYLSLEIGLLALTHIHGDHTDLTTLDSLLAGNKERVSVLGPLPVISLLRERYPTHRYVMMRPGVETVWRGVTIQATEAIHSDETAVGYFLETEGLRVLITGDTLYSPRLYHDVEAVDYLFTVINGEGNNMNALDAAKLVKDLRPRHAVPVHWDMFAAYSCDPREFTEACSNLPATDVLVPKHYEAMPLLPGAAENT